MKIEVFEGDTFIDAKYPDDFDNLRKMLKEVPGVYIFEDEQREELYIGSSKNLYARFSSHPFLKLMARIGVEAQVHLISIHLTEHFLDVERDLIRWFEPPFNGLLYGLMKS